MSLHPVSVKNHLAGNPQPKPHYGREVKLENGETLEVADPLMTRAWVALMDMQAVLGGAASHWGGPAAFAEVMSAIYGLSFHEGQKSGKPWYECMHVINDAGHCENGIYALKANYGFADLSVESLKGFRSIKSQLTGHGESHCFPEGVYLSNGPLGSSLPQAQGLAVADALSGNTERVTVTAISDGACMEGEAREAMAAIPGLADKGKVAPFVMVISDNNTKLSGRIDDQSYSMAPTFKSLSDLGWDVVTVKDGHDLQECVSTMEKVIAKVRANPKKPVAVHVYTVKGKGVKATEEASSGGHGFPVKDPKDIRAFLQEIFAGKELTPEVETWVTELENYQKPQGSSSVDVAPGVKREKVQVGITAAMNEKFEAGAPVVSVASDLQGSTGTAGFHKAHPEGALDIGIAESNMVSMAAGLSKQGFVPVVDTFAQFGVTKGALPMIMASLSEAPLIAVYSHVGFQDAADGASHQALTYLSMTSSIPNTDVYCLSCSAEAKALLGDAIDEFVEDRKQGKTPRSKVFFLGRENFPSHFLPEGSEYKMGKAQVVFDSSDEGKDAVTIVAAGAMLMQALEAAHLRKEKGLATIVVNPSVINRPDVQTIKACLQKSNGRLLTAEDHQVIGGMGALLTHALAQAGVSCQVKSLGVQDQFGQSAYQAVELYRKHSMDSSAMLEACAVGFPVGFQVT